MPKITQCRAQTIIRQYWLDIICGQELSAEILKALENFVLASEDAETIQILSQEAVWFLDRIGAVISNPLFPKRFIPYHVVTEIACMANLQDELDFVEALVVLERLGYVIESETTNNFRDRNLSANYREFADHEIDWLAGRVLDVINKLWRPRRVIDSEVLAKFNERRLRTQNNTSYIPPSGETAGLESAGWTPGMINTDAWANVDAGPN